MVENRKGRTSVQKLLIAVPNILYTPEYHMTAVLVDQESSGIWHITAFQQRLADTAGCLVNIVTPSPAKHFTHAYIYSYAGVHIIQIMLLDILQNNPWT